MRMLLDTHAFLWFVQDDDRLGRVAREEIILLQNDLDSLALVARLPLHHRDPFDRLLIAQAISQKLPIVTRDPAFAAYGVELIW